MAVVLRRARSRRGTMVPGRWKTGILLSSHTITCDCGAAYGVPSLKSYHFWAEAGAGAEAEMEAETAQRVRAPAAYRANMNGLQNTIICDACFEFY